jgi:hypothetical protein
MAAHFIWSKAAEALSTSAGKRRDFCRLAEGQPCAMSFRVDL